MPASASALAEPVALGAAGAEEVVDVAGLVGGQLDQVAQPQLGVARRRLATQLVPAVDLVEEDAQEGRLHLVETRVVAHVLEQLLVARAVEAEHAHAGRQLLVVGGDQAAVPEAEEVLGREEAEGGSDALLPDPVASEGLGSVLDHRQSVRRQLVDLDRAAEERYRHDRLGVGRDLARDVGGVDVHRLVLDVGEDGRRAELGDRLGGGVEGEGGADDLVARPDLERAEHERDGVGAVAATDRVGDAELGGRLLLEGLDVGAEDELARLEHFGETRL